MTATLAVTSWSAVSAFGIGGQAFSEGITSGRTALRAVQEGTPTDPVELDGSVPGFDLRQVLGRKNTRSMDRVTGLTVATVGRLLDGERGAGHELDGADTGLVLGTTTGSVQSMMDFSRDSFTQDKPYLVDPARFPNAVMNCAAGQSAIWHGLRGPNTTIASGQAAGLSALRYAARLQRSRHARSVLVGAVEELTPQRRWLERQRRERDTAVPLGEGCAIFRLESAEDAAAGGRPALAYLAATAFRVYGNAADIPGAVADCASSVLKAAGASATDIWLVVGDLSAATGAGLTEVIGDDARRVGLVTTIGDTGAASAALQVAALLSYAAVEPAAGARLALVVSVDRDGLAGIAAFRLPSQHQPSRHQG